MDCPICGNPEFPEIPKTETPELPKTLAELRQERIQEAWAVQNLGTQVH